MVSFQGTPIRESAEAVKRGDRVDAGDALTYVYIAETLTYNGRAAEALPYLKTAMRLDPHYPSFYAQVLGKAQFGLERYDEAAALPLKRQNSSTLKMSGFISFLAATYAYLGRKEEAKARCVHGSARLELVGAACLKELMMLTSALSVRNPGRGSSKDRCWRACRSKPSTKSTLPNIQLHANEIRALFLGHTVHGRDLAKATQHSATVSVEGVASMTGDWGEVSGGTFHLEGELLRLLPAEVLDIAVMSFAFRVEPKQRKMSIIGEGERFLRQSSAYWTILRLAR